MDKCIKCGKACWGFVCNDCFDTKATEERLAKQERMTGLKRRHPSFKNEYIPHSTNNILVGKFTGE